MLALSALFAALRSALSSASADFEAELVVVSDLLAPVELPVVVEDLPLPDALVEEPVVDELVAGVAEALVDELLWLDVDGELVACADAEGLALLEEVAALVVADGEGFAVGIGVVVPIGVMVGETDADGEGLALGVIDANGVAEAAGVAVALVDAPTPVCVFTPVP